MRTNRALLFIILGLLVIGGLIWLSRTPQGEELGVDIFRGTSPTPADRQPTPVGEDLLNRNEERINLSSLPDSQYQQTGRATLTETEDGVRVVVELGDADPAIDTSQPVHIHNGTCLEPGDIIYSLNPVNGGRSTTVLADVIFDDLRTDPPYIINAHKSIDELQVQTTCGELTL